MGPNAKEIAIISLSKWLESGRGTGNLGIARIFGMIASFLAQ